MENELLKLIKNNSVKDVYTFLSNSIVDIDVLHKKGLAIKLSVVNDNPEIFKILVNYYINTVLIKYKFDTTDYNIARFKLKKIIDNTLNRYDVPDIILFFLKEKNLLPYYIN